MTREIKAYEKAFAKEVSTKRNTVRKSRLSVLAKKAAVFCTKAAEAKRTISDGFVLWTETLADKTAREGLFGEDKGKGYCGTDVDYIED